MPLWTLPAHMEAADLVVNLRYPTARETSAALLRLLAQGRPTVISDLEHLADIPGDAVVRADLTDEEGEVTRAILRLSALAPAPPPPLRRGAPLLPLVSIRPRACATRTSPRSIAPCAAPAPEPRAGWPAHWR